MIAILRQFDVYIKYKPAAKIIVPDALSRCHPHTLVGTMDSSTAEENITFPYVQDPHSPYG